MTCGVGGAERPIWIMLGILLAGLGALGWLPTAGTVTALIAGVVALVTGVIGHCKAWTSLGMNMCPATVAKE